MRIFFNHGIYSEHDFRWYILRCTYTWILCHNPFSLVVTKEFAHIRLIFGTCVIFKMLILFILTYWESGAGFTRFTLTLIAMVNLILISIILNINFKQSTTYVKIFHPYIVFIPFRSMRSFCNLVYLKWDTKRISFL